MKYHFIFVNTLLLTLLSYISVGMVYTLAEARFDTFMVSLNPTSSPHARGESSSHHEKKKKSKPISHYRTIVKRDLFKTSKKKAESQVITDDSLKLTDLDLKLWGTITGNTKQLYAVIEETKGGRRGQNQMLYSTGDQIQGATIVRIMDEKVILERQGENEVLELETFKSNGRRYNRYRNSLSSNRVRHLKRSIKRSDITDAMSDLNGLMKQARFYPHVEGIKVSRIRRNSIFRKVGLRNGDIITGIDGRKITSIDDAMGFYSQLSAASNLSVELKRRGKPQVIDFDIN